MRVDSPMEIGCSGAGRSPAMSIGFVGAGAAAFIAIALGASAL
jgi:hypothetical protein